jgi:hypothetical protein
LKICSVDIVIQIKVFENMVTMVAVEVSVNDYASGDNNDGEEVCEKSGIPKGGARNDDGGDNHGVGLSDGHGNSHGDGHGDR